MNPLANKYNVTGRKAKIENGQPRITPVAATATAIVGLSRRNRPDEREIAYMENELGKKPGNPDNVHKIEATTIMECNKQPFHCKEERKTTSK